MKKSKFSIRYGLSALVCAALACSAGGFGSDPDATVEALAAALEQTAQVAADTSGGGAGGGDDLVATAEAAATQSSIESAVTQAAVAELDAAVLAATAEFEAPFLARLPEYGLDAAQGKLAWVHPPAAIEIDGYLQYDYVNQRIATVVQDFMIESDVTWNTVTGLSGCGFAVRASITEGATEEENTFTGYLLIASRIDTGRAGFGVLVDNEPVAGDELYARGVDRSFEWQNDGTNRLGIVGIGDTFIFYTNGTEIGRFSAPPEYRFEKGFVAMVALSESSRTYCQFDNTWLWLIDSGTVSPPPLGTVVGPPPQINPPGRDIPFGMICGLPFVPLCP